MNADELPGWRKTPAKHSIVEFIGAVTDPGSADFVPERDRVAVFDAVPVKGAMRRASCQERSRMSPVVFRPRIAAPCGRQTSTRVIPVKTAYGWNRSQNVPV